MKIMKIRLRNFKMIRSAMNTDELFIDFSNTENRICLIIGPNGSGKTTLLSMLHPFADLGNLDIRNSNNLIIEGKEGYKEIHIRKNKDYYIVKHYYTAHKDKNHSVKSYIEKNGNELNVNGNVTSFKEFVKEELQIEPDYLKLIRLGANVTSLIDLTATERKNFMSKIMDDIDIYLEYYKSVNTKLRQLDEMISHEVDKEKRLGIINQEDFQDEIYNLEIEINVLNDEFVKLNNRLAILQNTLNGIEDLENLKTNLNQVSKKFKKMSSILEQKDKIDSFDISFYEEKIKELERTISVNDNEYVSNTALIQNSLEHLNSLQEQLRTLSVQLSKELEGDKEIERMEEIQTSMRKRLREHEDIIGDFKPSFTKLDLDNFIVFLKNTQQILGRTYEFGKGPVERVVSLMKKKQNVMNYINSHLLDIDDKSSDSSSVFINTIASRFLHGNNDIVIECKSVCQAKTLFEQIQNLIKNSEIPDKNEDVSFYRDMEFVYNNLISVLPNFSTYKEIIESLPEEIRIDFTIDSIYDKISKLEVIYDDKKINQLLSLTTEYDNYVKLLKEYNDHQDLIRKFSGMSNSLQLKSQIEIVKGEIDEVRLKIRKWKERNLILIEEKNECNRSLETYHDIHETIERFDEIKGLFEKYTKDFELFNQTYEEINQINLDIHKTKLNIENRSSIKKKMEIDLSQYESIRKDIKKMNKIYDEMTYVKESLSSKQGIPLHFISNYLRNIEDITNKLLDIAYDGKIYLDSFEITANEFSIPFYNKGIRLDDVKYASQGELSFLSVALAFALSSQALSKYNIMLLDELDGPLDVKNREKFIQILENQIERINAEQSFLITHNVMFSAYPVDILDFSFNNDTKQYPLANFIEIVR